MERALAVLALSPQAAEEQLLLVHLLIVYNVDGDRGLNVASPAVPLDTLAYRDRRIGDTSASG